MATKLGRPKGKSSDPNYTQVSVLLPKELHQRVKMALLKRQMLKSQSSEVSELIEKLLNEWVEEEEEEIAS